MLRILVIHVGSKTVYKQVILFICYNHIYVIILKDANADNRLALHLLLSNVNLIDSGALNFCL